MTDAPKNIWVEGHSGPDWGWGACEVSEQDPRPTQCPVWEYTLTASVATQLKAADEMEARLVVALDELADCSIELTGEDYNCPDHNAALNAYRKAKEQAQ